jgi:hypothetical protein
MQINTIHITTYQERTWGRVYVSYQHEEKQYFAFKNYINFIEHNFIGNGFIEDEPAFNWFTEEKRFIFSVNEVLEGKADTLYLTPEKWKSQYGTPSTLLRRLLIDIYSENLTPVERRRGWFEHFHIPKIQLSDIHITKEYKQIVLNEYFTEISFEPLMKTLYIFFLKHPEGVKRTDLIDHSDELHAIYTQITQKSDLNKVAQSIASLTDNLGKSFDEKISKIKKQLTDLLGEKLARHYKIYKSETEEYVISIPSSKIKFD